MQTPFQQSNLRFLLSRTDNIGDVILTLPMVHLLKQRFPDCTIMFLARDYVKPIVDAYSAIDEFISWDTLQKQNERDAAAYLSTYQIDIAIHVFPRHDIARLIFRANIPYRIGTSHRWYHYLYCNQRIRLNRKNSVLHEAQLNIALLAPFDISSQYSLTQLTQSLKLSPKSVMLPKKIEKLFDQNRFNLVIHALSNSNGREWPLEYYQQLIASLPDNQFNIFITGAPHEAAALKPLIDQCPKSHNLVGQLDLSHLIRLIQRCDGLLAGSTGPLHIASALGIKTLGLYPPAQTMNPVRWAPVGPQVSYLVAKFGCAQKCLNPDQRTCACMRAVTVDQVRAVLLSWKK